MPTIHPVHLPSHTFPFDVTAVFYCNQTINGMMNPIYYSWKVTWPSDKRVMESSSMNWEIGIHFYPNRTCIGTKQKKKRFAPYYKSSNVCYLSSNLYCTMKTHNYKHNFMAGPTKIQWQNIRWCMNDWPKGGWVFPYYYKI